MLSVVQAEGVLGNFMRLTKVNIGILLTKGIVTEPWKRMEGRLLC